MATPALQFRAPPYIREMIDSLKKQFNCNLTQLIKHLIIEKYNELKTENKTRVRKG